MKRNHLHGVQASLVLRGINGAPTDKQGDKGLTQQKKGT